MFIKVKTSELEGSALDWAVAKCEGFECSNDMGLIVVEEYEDEYFSPSMKWSQGGWIIEREEIGLTYSGSMPCWYATSQHGKRFLRLGNTPLIAAMRCYVASKLGDTVKIPKELIKC